MMKEPLRRQGKRREIGGTDPRQRDRAEFVALQHKARLEPFRGIRKQQISVLVHGTQDIPDKKAQNRNRRAVLLVQLEAQIRLIGPVCADTEVPNPASASAWSTSAP